MLSFVILIQANKDHHSCFISYCWSNSRDAVEKGTKSKEGSVGWGDPRVIKKYLQDKSISTWIDHEETMCGVGIFLFINTHLIHR